MNFAVVPDMTTFGEIMRAAVESTPGAIGGAFADSEGEMVDGYTTIDRTAWAILTAHYGVILVQVVNAFGTWHFGGPEYFIAQHEKLDIIVHAVANGYYALLAVAEDHDSAPLGSAIASLRRAAAALEREIA